MKTTPTLIFYLLVVMTVMTLITVISVVSGCASQPTSPPNQNFRWSDIKRTDMLQQYKKMQNCCRSANEIEFEKFPNENGWSFNISQYDKAIELDTGLSPIKAYQLPKTKHDYKLTILTHSLRDREIHCFADCSYMYIPIILFLDSAYMPLYTFLPGDLRLHDPSRKPKNQHGYAHRIKIEGDNKAKYFVIYTTPSLVKNSAEFSFTRNAAVYSDNGTAITGSPFGQFTISIEKYISDTPANTE